MPKNSQNEMFSDWAALLRSVRENEGELAGVAPLRETLEAALRQAQIDKTTRDSLARSTEDATGRLQQSLAAGQDAASCLRSFVKSMIGPRDPRLAIYGIKPLGRRRTGNHGFQVVASRRS